MKEGDASWEFYTKGVDVAWTDALRRYATAYRLHPRDREASAALRRLAKSVLAAYPEARTTLALQMAEESPEYLASYGPVQDALGGLKSKEAAPP